VTLEGKHPQFIRLTDTPPNGNVPPSLLAQDFITPTECFFVRSHGTIPQIRLEDYRLTVRGLVEKPLSLSFDDLRRFAKVDVMATLQCAGNRRDELAAIEPIPDEIIWGHGAISNAVWGGVRLHDVLIEAGVDPQAQHVACTGLDEVERGTSTLGFGGSIPLTKALLPETLLAYEMNGKPLPPLHGFPLRLIVPGYIGARSIKWLNEVVVQQQPSDNYFQQRAYKLFPPDIRRETVDWKGGIMLGENTLNAVICSPTSGATVEAGTTCVLGYALSNEHGVVERVELSLDEGQSWQAATFLAEQHDGWTWRLWQAQVVLPAGEVCILARASDSDGNTQPKDARDIWNFKGYGNNAWHRVTVQVTENKGSV
jgi:sulfite oxidase